MTYSDNYSNARYPHLQDHQQQHPSYPKPSQSYNHHPSNYHHHIQHPVPVKVEVNESRSLHSASSYHQQSLAQFCHKPVLPAFRFGETGSNSVSSPSPTTPTSSFSFMSQHPWPSLPSSSSSSATSFQQQQQQYASDRLHGYSLPSSLNGHSQGHAQPIALNEDYDDGEEDALAELPHAGLSIGMGGYAGSGYGGDAGGQDTAKGGEKQIRRRSSKACDQCRKSKCKCERSSPNDPCRNCIMLGTREPFHLRNYDSRCRDLFVLL